MSRSRGILTALVSGLVLSIMVGSSAFAADAKAAPSIATVDVEQAFNNYDKKKQLEADFMNMFTQAKARLELRNTNKLLTDEEFNQFADLKAKPKPADADTKRIDELTNISNQRQQEFQALQQKQNATDAEKTRLNQLQDQINKTDASLKDQQDKYEADLGKKRVDLSAQVMTDVQAAVAAVAKDKGYTLIFNKSASDSGLVVYSNVDITDDVLKRLNKK